MSRIFYALKIGLVVLTLIAAAGSGYAADDDRIFDLSLTEVRDLVNGFLSEGQFQVLKLSGDQNVTHLVVDRGPSHMEITIEPHSALATRVRVNSTGPAGLKDTIEALWRWIEHGGGAGPVASNAGAAELPLPLIRLADAVVCIYADTAKQDFQSSGFVIDPKGLILSTAHELKAEQMVNVVLADGSRAKGRVIKLDKVRDLSLIDVGAPLPGSILLASGRFLLRSGEDVYALNCARRLNEHFRLGVVDGPPRRANGLPLWQVNMLVAPGDSGSPVFDDSGHLVAVIKGRLRGTNSVGFLIPFETVLHFLEIY